MEILNFDSIDVKDKANEDQNDVIHNERSAFRRSLKIKLISPRMSLRPMDSEFKRRMSPSLSLLTVAALTPDGNEVYIEDENVEELNFDDKPDLVGITATVDTAKRAYDIAESYRKRIIPVVLGGIHPSVNADEALQYADSVCIGDAEELWPQIIHDTAHHRLQKIYRHTKPVDLNNTPLPRFDLVDRSKYLYTNIIASSRGCPFSCDFCYNSSDAVNRAFRNRPIENVIQEIAAMKTKHVMFIDDNFIGNLKWTKEFMQRIKPLGLKWNAAVSTNIGNHLDLLDQMKESGCQSLFIGFETINKDSLNAVNKMQNKVEKYEKLVDELHSRDIMINASLVFGFDHDTSDVFQDTLKWLVKNKIETMTSHILTPYPGTKLFERFKHDNRIVDVDWNHYNTSNVVFEPKNISKEELLNGYLWMYDQFYSFSNIIKRLPDNKQRWLSFFLFNFGYRKFGKFVSKVGKAGFMNFIGRLARKLSYGIE